MNTCLFACLPEGVKLSPNRTNELLRTEADLYKLVRFLHSLDLSQIDSELFSLLVIRFKKQHNFIPLLVQVICQSHSLLALNEVSKLCQFVRNLFPQNAADLAPLLGVLFRFFPALFKNSRPKWQQFAESDPLLFASWLCILERKERKELLSQKFIDLFHLIRDNLLVAVKTNFSSRTKKIISTSIQSGKGSSVGGMVEDDLMLQISKASIILCHALSTPGVEVDLDFIVHDLLCGIWGLVREQTIPSSSLPESDFIRLCERIYPQLHLLGCKIAISLLSSLTTTNTNRQQQRRPSVQFMRVKVPFINALSQMLSLYSGQKDTFMLCMICRTLELAVIEDSGDDFIGQEKCFISAYFEACLKCWPQCSLEPFYSQKQLHESLWNWIFCTANSDILSLEKRHTLLIQVAIGLLPFCEPSTLARVIPLLKACFSFHSGLYQLMHVLARRNKFVFPSSSTCEGRVSEIVGGIQRCFSVSQQQHHHHQDNSNDNDDRLMLHSEEMESVSASEVKTVASSSLQIPAIDFE